MTRDLRSWIASAEKEGMVVDVDAEVDWNEEMAAVTYMAHRRAGAPALLFNKVKGYPKGYHALFNMFSSSTGRVALTMNLPSTTPIRDLIRTAKDRFRQRVPPKVVKDGPIFENTLEGDDVDLSRFPAPQMWPKDGGWYLGTADTTITKDPETGRLNLGTYRGMIHDRNKIGLYVSPGKDAGLHMRKWWELGRPCEVAVAYGTLPELFFVSGLFFPKNVSEYELAGALTGEPVEVVRGRHTDLLLPANAEVVIEGVIRSDSKKPEGPFGEFTGCYARPPGDVPYIDVKAIHFRNDPIITCALMADYPSCDQSMHYAVGRSASICADLETLGIPGIECVYAHPAAASGMGMTIASIKQMHAGHAAQVAALAAQCPAGGYFSKAVIVVDDDVDPTDTDQVIWAMATRMSPERDVDIIRQTWSTWLDPAKYPIEDRPWGSKLLINACADYKHIQEFGAETTKLRREIYQHVRERWKELGLPGSPPEVKRLTEERERLQEPKPRREIYEFTPTM